MLFIDPNYLVRNVQAIWFDLRVFQIPRLSKYMSPMSRIPCAALSKMANDGAGVFGADFNANPNVAHLRSWVGFCFPQKYQET